MQTSFTSVVCKDEGSFLHESSGRNSVRAKCILLCLLFPPFPFLFPFLISLKWCPQPGLQEPRCDSGQPAVLCWQLYCDNLLLHSNSAHQEDMSVPHPGRAGSGPDSCHLIRGLLQYPSGWCACMRHLAAQTECSKPAGLQHIQVPLRHWYLPTMLSGPGPSYIQDMIELYTAAHPLQSATANWLPAPAL